MVTTRTRINRRPSAITPEMIDAFQTIQREYRGGVEAPSDEFLDAFTRLHLLLDLWPCHPSPALVHSPEPEGANEFITACYADSWGIRQRIEEAIDDARRRERAQSMPVREREPTP